MLAFVVAGCAKKAKEYKNYPWASGDASIRAVLLGTDKISTGAFELNVTMNEEGTEVWFARARAGTLNENMTILHSLWVEGKGWSRPDTASFSGKFVDADPAISPDGKRLYFSSKRGANGLAKGDFDIWYVEKAGEGWSEPVRLPEPVNSHEHDVSPCITSDGSLWFCSKREGGEGEYDVWYALEKNGVFDEPVNAGPMINGLGSEVDVCLTRDSNRLFFTSHDQMVHFGSGDVYMMSRSGEEWSGPFNLGQPVNSEAMECCPSLSPDGHYLFFSSTRSLGRGFVPSEDGTSISLPNIPGNGLGDIYYVDLTQIPVVQEVGWGG